MSLVLDKRFFLGCVCGSISSTILVVWVLRRRDSSLDSVAENDADSEGNFIAAGTELLKWITNYRTKSVKDFPVVSTVKPNYLSELLPASAPASSESWTKIISDLNTAILPGLTNWERSSKFFAYFKPHASYPAVLGELLCAGLNVMGFDWIASPACTELEVVVLDWLAKFLTLPSKFYNLHEGPGNVIVCTYVIL